MSRNALFFLIFFVTGLLSGQVWGQEFSPYGNPLTRLTVKDTPVVAEVVSTPKKRYLGLSHRRELPEGQGMLFLFRAPRRRGALKRKSIPWPSGSSRRWLSPR